MQWWAFEATGRRRRARRGRRAVDDPRAAPDAGARSRSTGRWTCATRPFEPGRDEDAFLAVNNRACAAHPEQGGWTRATARASARTRPWFDPAGFLLHERDGRLAAFCWTKIAPGRVTRARRDLRRSPSTPTSRGLGLGNQLTLAGLASIAARGVTVGMLYVDGGNTAAVTMYEHLGFPVHPHRRAFTADIASAR